MLPRRTPCASWDLGMLLSHLRDSLEALREGASLGRVAAARPAGDGDPVSAVRVSAVRLLLAPDPPHRVGVGDLWLEGELMNVAGAVEVAVHAWDVAQASGERRPVPTGLADDLLRLCPLVVPVPRRPLFAEPVDADPGGGAGERLVAYLGRRPLR
ncbi:MAG TPA: TIGR03086 family protein [Spirillospora sp.]